MTVRLRNDGIESRRSARAPALGTALLLGLAATHCEQLPEGYCLPCEKDCPGDLICSEQGKCVDPNGAMSCDDAGITGDVSSVGGSGGTSNHPSCPSDSSCIPSLVSPERLSVDCSDEPVALPLDVKCSCDDEPRTGSWTLLEGPPGLTIDDGVLGGTPPPGVHSISASVRIDDSPPLAVHLELEVSECFSFFVEAGTDGGAAHVAAARTDTGEIRALATPGSDALFSSFDLSPAGDLMAQVFTSDGRQELQVFRMTRGSISEVPLVYAGNHVAHAFSLDSRWLALVTSDSSDSEASLLSLFDLDHPEQVADEAAISGSEGLTWSNTGSILRFAEAETLPEQRVVFEHRVSGGKLFDPIELQQAATAGQELLHALVRTPDGFMATFREKLLFVGDARADVRVEHSGAEAFSPGVTWVASGDSAGKRIDYLNESPMSPHMRATECDLLRAWSPDDSTIFCTTSTSEGSRALVYPVPSERGVPDAIELGFPNGYEQTSQSTTTRSRVALSGQGAWLALVPNRDDGLFVLRADDFEAGVLDTPVLEPPAGSFEWDMLFAHDAFTGVPKQLVVQQGRALLVAALNGEEPIPEFTPIDDIELPPVPSCQIDWFPDLSDWCGAPEFAGNLMLSRTQRYLTFHDTGNRVYVIDLESLELTRLGTLASACCPECPEDRAANCLLTQ